MSGRDGRWAAEFLLIVLGVLVAFAVENWRQSRSDDTRAGLLLEGIAADLQRDVDDLERSIVSAQARVAATDDLLRLIGDPDSAMLSVAPPGDFRTLSLITGNWSTLLSQARVAFPVGSFNAQQALLVAGASITFDISDATYAEARDNGWLELIEDAELRSAIAAHYIAIRLGESVERERFGSAIPRLVEDLQTAGLTPASGASDAQVAAALSRYPSVVAGLKNVRYAAGCLTDFYGRRLASTTALLERLPQTDPFDRYAPATP